MKVIFLQDMPNLAEAGEMKEVADGYGRNFLIPQKLALLAKPGATSMIEAQRQIQIRKQEQIEVELVELAHQLDGKEINLKARAGASGGQIADAEQVENYPGFPEGVSGFELGQLMHQQATKYGLETIIADATGIELQGEQKVVKTTEGNFTAKVVIIASGSERSKLGVPREDKFTGKGVSYCATCDAAFFKEKPVAVVGGGDAAITEALHLTKFASRVIVIHRRHQLRASRILQEKALSEPKIEFMWNSIVEEIVGEDLVKRIKLRQVTTGEESALDVAGVFIAIGVKPNTGYLKGILPLDSAGHIITNDKMETEISGIFAAGDIRHDSARQAITAAGDGATAAIYAEKFITR